MKRILLAILISGISLLAGLMYPQIKEFFIQKHKEHQDVGLLVSIPEKGVQTNKLSLKLFRNALEENSKGQNTFISPYLTNAILEELSLITDGKLRKAINNTLSRTSGIFSALTAPTFAILSARDFSLPLPQNPAYTVRLPFKSDKLRAQGFFNKAMSQLMEPADIRILTNENCSEYTRLILGAACYMRPKWQIKFTGNNTSRGDFYNENGAIPRVDMMRCRGLIRTAKADDESWEAVALFISPNQEGNTPIAFIGIIPNHDIQHVKENLSIETINDIRLKLAQATPKDCLVEMPRIICEAPVLSYNKQMNVLGLSDLFDANKADFSPITTQKIAMDGIYAKISLALVENESQGPIISDDAPLRITFDKPFIWIIGDLTSDAPPYYMGFLQNF